MEVKDTWTDDDFEEMGWHDSHIHSVSFPADETKLIFDLDYLFKWELHGKFYKFWVSPCILTFQNALYFKFNLDFKDSVGLDIENINRINSRLTPNSKMTIWDYIIETDKGTISFESTGFIQKVRKQPILSYSQTLTRQDVFE